MRSNSGQHTRQSHGELTRADVLSPSSTSVITAAHATRVHLPITSATTPGRPPPSHEPFEPCSPTHDDNLRDDESAGARLRMVPLDVPVLDIRDKLAGASSPHARRSVRGGHSAASCESAQTRRCECFPSSLLIFLAHALALRLCGSVISGLARLSFLGPGVYCRG